jgi:hypothetical protein
MTAKDVLLTARLAQLDSDRQQHGLGYRLYALTPRLKDGGPVDLDAADAAFLQQRLEAVGFPPLTLGQMTDLLNGRTGPSAEAASPATT